MKLRRAPNQYTQVGAGAIPRLVTDKSREVVSALDYSARGNDSFDNGPSLNAMFDDFTSGTTGVSPDGMPTPIFKIPSGIYLISETLRFPNGSLIMGDGRWNTYIKAAPGFTGPMLQDKGNASKVIIRDLAVWANEEAGVTDLINLGMLGGGQWGTGGYLKNLFLRGGNTVTIADSCGVRASHNITYIDNVEVWLCANGFVEEAGSIGSQYSNIGITDIAPGGYGIYMHRGVIKSLEIESPQDGSVGVYVLRSGSIKWLMYSQIEDETNAHAVEIDASAEMFEMGFFENIQRGSGPTQSILTDIIKDNRATHPLHWGDPLAGRPAHAMGFYDEVHIGSPRLTFRGQMKQNFTLRLFNNAGTIQHSIGAAGDATIASAYAGKVVGSTATLGNTPTGTDSSTAMATGGKISSASTNCFILNTAAQESSTYPVIEGCGVTYNTTGTQVIAQGQITSRNVNSVTQRRLEIFYYNATTGAAFALGVGNIPNGTFLDVLLSVFIK